MRTTEVASFAEGKPASRRSYIGWLVGLCSAGVGAVLAVPLIRFSLYPLRANTTEVKWSDVGPASAVEGSTQLRCSATICPEAVMYADLCQGCERGYSADS